VSTSKKTTFNGEVVAFAGDWHGDANWAAGRIMSAGEQGIPVICHVGDFGIWPGNSGKKYLMAVEKTCVRYGVTILVTPGNHEDWDRLDLKQAKDKGDGWGAVKHLSDHIKVLPRAHRFTMTTPAGTTRTFVSLGGAPSVDYPWRTEGRDWFPTEMITDDDVAATVAGGHADIMIAHDSPDAPYAVEGVTHILAHNPMGFPVESLAYAKVGRDRMTTAYEGVAPKMFFHGHYHVAGARLVTQHGEPERWVISLDMQRTASNIARLNLDTLELV
jgi:hypothetical protein